MRATEFTEDSAAMTEEFVSAVDNMWATQYFEDAKYYATQESEESVTSQLYCIKLQNKDEVINYMRQRDKMLHEHTNIKHEYERNWRRASVTAILISESTLPAEQNKFLQKFKSLDQYNNLIIKIGSKVSILNAEISGERFNLWGFVDPKVITNIRYTDGEEKILQFEFNNDPTDVWPRIDNAEFNGRYLSHSAFFRNKDEAEQALTMLAFSKPADIVLTVHIDGYNR